jgi:DNA polymerase III psi subunit
VLEAGLLPVVGPLMSSDEPTIAATAKLVFSSNAWVKAEEEFEHTINLQRKQWQQIQQQGHDQRGENTNTG